ncbi:MAG: tRNA (adenine-N(6)-)-methyltransferase [Clostridium sp.]|nr:tRNA (adenine-N(6)-)-methyltransferase [Clostridium sp.]
MKQALIDYAKRGEYNELYTPKTAIAPVVKYIPRDVKTVWCPFDTKESEIVKTLEENGIEVINSHIWEGKDFFEYEPDDYDMIISNPPFSKKEDVMNRLYALGKPWMMLYPLTALEGAKRHELYKNGIGVIVFDKRVDFNGKKSTWFNTSWFIHHPLYDGRILFERLTSS